MPIRTRFAPSPTGGLHLGGVRTALYSYLYAKKNNGTFVLRIEDTDQTRFVAGAEEYIIECLKWVNIPPTEGVGFGNGNFSPYRQSERKNIYHKYALELIQKNYAYYDFSTPEDLDNARQLAKQQGNDNWQYDAHSRQNMKNSLTLSPNQTTQLLNNNTPHAIRIKMPHNTNIILNDLIRGEVRFDSNLVDDKVLLKADGLPTYHLAVVIDDYLMEITHAFRGEEWLPSAPVHVLLYQYLGWQDKMPKFAHLPLIMKPDGKGKLSKRDGDRLGFPVYALTWQTPENNEIIYGFREKGFLPQAFINILAMLGWNPGTEQEVFSLEELIQVFDIERVHKAGAKFDFEKAKWFNQQHIKQSSPQHLLPYLMPFAPTQYQNLSTTTLIHLITLLKDRITLLPDFWQQVQLLFTPPQQYEFTAIANKWKPQRLPFFEDIITQLNTITEFTAPNIEQLVKTTMKNNNLGMGEVMPILRIALVGNMSGPSVFDSMAALEKTQTIKRLQTGIQQINQHFSA